MAAEGADPSRASTTRVVLADDDVLLREGLASLLERSGLEVVGQCGTSDELLEFVRTDAPELAIVDIRMPPTHSLEGLQAARVIREEAPGTAVVVLSAHVELEHAMDLLASGQRSGYLLKSRVTDVKDSSRRSNASSKEAPPSTRRSSRSSSAPAAGRIRSTS
jgi:DNA-binding NarL/FixJ family response regulator